MKNGNKFNCELDENLNSNSKNKCSEYNSGKLIEGADLGVLENMCNGEPNCKWVNDTCMDFNCNDAKNEMECKKPTCKWKHTDENNKFKYITNNNNKLSFHDISESDLDNFNLSDIDKNTLLKSHGKPSIFDMIKEKADTYILAEGFGRRITFIDIFLGLLVIVLLFRLKK